MKRYFQFLLVCCLLIAAYVLGAWKNRDTTQKEAPTNDVITDRSDNRLTKDERATISLFENASASVVFITTTTLQRDFWSMRAMEIPHGTGSGFFWDEDGHIVTNFHVVQNAKRITVTLQDQTSHEAEYVGGAPEKDLALLYVRGLKKKQIIPIARGDSDKLQVGQSTYAIGNPFGLDHTLTTGIVSALGREIKSVSGLPIKDVIQTDAAINPGNSGGPLLNSSGQLIGVNTSIYSPSGAYAGIGFSIPISVLQWVIPDLLHYGKVQRLDLGIDVANERMQQRLGIKRGLLIWNVHEKGPAFKQGFLGTRRTNAGRIELGDIILQIDEYEINSESDLILSLEKLRLNHSIKIRYQRGTKIKEETIPIK